MALRLYTGGYGNYQCFVVAENGEDAIEKIGVKLNAKFLPVVAEEITEVDGYEICPTSKDKQPLKADKTDEAPEREEASKPAVTLRHCKKCDFATESQGELLRHYREEHPKEA